MESDTEFQYEGRKYYHLPLNNQLEHDCTPSYNTTSNINHTTSTSNQSMEKKTHCLQKKSKKNNRRRASSASIYEIAQCYPQQSISNPFGYLFHEPRPYHTALGSSTRFQKPVDHGLSSRYFHWKALSEDIEINNKHQSTMWICIKNPTSNDYFTRGLPYTIEWDVLDKSIEHVRIALFNDAWPQESILIQSTPNNGQFIWNKVSWGLPSGSGYYLRFDTIDSGIKRCGIVSEQFHVVNSNT